MLLGEDSELRAKNADQLRTQIFLSFSRDAKNYVPNEVVQLHNALRARGLSMWVDWHDLQAGSPDWERDVRQAMQASMAVIFVASKRTRDNAAVRAELTLARSQGIPIYPIWIDGDVWIDCVPLELVSAQFIDWRTRSDDAALDRLGAGLEKLAVRSLPQRILLEEAYVIERVEKAADHVFTSVRTAPLPPGYLGVILDDISLPGIGRATAPGVMLRARNYTTLRSLLDDVYLRFLRTRYPPLTYGQRWILTATEHVIAPWSWLVHPMTAAESESFGQAPLEDLEIETGGYHWLTVSEAKPDDFIGIASKNRQFLRRMRADYKGFLRHTAKLLPVDPLKPVEPDTFRMIVKRSEYLGASEHSSRAFEVPRG